MTGQTSRQADIICIGSVLWDVIGRAAAPMHLGADQPGRISRLPGGVAMNIAMTLRRFGMVPALLSAIGRDPAGDDLLARAQDLGLICDYLYRSPALPTDIYMAIEDETGLIAAIADAHSLEQAGAAILQPLADGRLGSAAQPWRGLVALDGNLTDALLGEIAQSPLFAAADLRVAPASPGKALRLLALLGHPAVTLYVNKAEAQLLCGQDFACAASAAQGLVARGAERVLVTDGGAAAADADAAGVITALPPQVRLARVTGAGDTFMAAHLAAEQQGQDRGTALARACRAAATYVAGETP